MSIVGKFTAMLVEEKIVQLNKKFFISLAVVVICFFLDRITKFLVIDYFIKNNLESYYVNSFFNIVLLWNKGIAFGMLQSTNFIYELISILILIIIFFVCYLVYRSNSKTEVIFFSLIVGGAIGNLFDRYYYSAVPDFIDLHYKTFHWFTFNVSDICITIGIALLLYYDTFKNIINKYE